MVSDPPPPPPGDDELLSKTLGTSLAVQSRTCLTCLRGGGLVSFEVFKRSPQPLKAGIVATAAFRKFLVFSMYSQRCIITGSVVACSACDLIRVAASPYLTPVPLLSLRSNIR